MKKAGMNCQCQNWFPGGLFPTRQINSGRKLRCTSFDTRYLRRQDQANLLTNEKTSKPVGYRTLLAAVDCDLYISRHGNDAGR